VVFLVQLKKHDDGKIAVEYLKISGDLILFLQKVKLMKSLIRAIDQTKRKKKKFIVKIVPIQE